MFGVSRGRRAQGGWGSDSGGPCRQGGARTGVLRGGNYPLGSTSSERPTRDLEGARPRKKLSSQHVSCPGNDHGPKQGSDVCIKA